MLASAIVLDFPGEDSAGASRESSIQTLFRSNTERAAFRAARWEEPNTRRWIGLFG